MLLTHLFVKGFHKKTDSNIVLHGCFLLICFVPLEILFD